MFKRSAIPRTLPLRLKDYFQDYRTLLQNACSYIEWSIQVNDLESALVNSQAIVEAATEFAAGVQLAHTEWLSKWTIQSLVFTDSDSKIDSSDHSNLNPIQTLAFQLICNNLTEIQDNLQSLRLIEHLNPNTLKSNSILILEINFCDYQELLLFNSLAPATESK